MGGAIFQIIAVLKAMEVEVLHERTMDGLKAARARGRKGGRKPGSYNKERSMTAAALYKQGLYVSEVMRISGIRSKSTLYEYLRREGVKE
jgi:DNA invertase Pin-like site-specific DNA recombinase